MYSIKSSIVGRESQTVVKRKTVKASHAFCDKMVNKINLT